MDMKIGIVTVHNSHNCGSYLQAKALCSFVEALGYDARFVKNKIHPQSSLLYKSIVAGKYFLKGNRKKATDIFNGSMRFVKARKSFSYYSSFKDADVCIFGSDTIWNLNSKHLTKQWEHYFGFNFNGKKIAYAPSVGDAPIANILNNPMYCKCINDFDYLSVRDENTYKLVSSVTGKDDSSIKFVVDPTMLMQKSFYEQIAAKCEDENFILFYYFGVPEKGYMEKIKKYADDNGKKLICFGNGIKKVDKQVPFSPLEMMGYYSKADLVITNTFHGNVFSIIFNKPFVNIDAGKAKVDDLLASFGLSERTVKEHCDFEKIASKNIDFEVVNNILDEKRKSSGDYLKNVLKECERQDNNA